MSDNENERDEEMSKRARRGLLASQWGSFTTSDKGFLKDKDDDKNEKQEITHTKVEYGFAYFMQSISYFAGNVRTFFTGVRDGKSDEKYDKECTSDDDETCTLASSNDNIWSAHAKCLPRFVEYQHAKITLNEGKSGLKGPLGNTFTMPTGEDFMVRGTDYLNGSTKSPNVSKVPSGKPLYRVAGVTIFRCSKSLEHVASKVDSLKEFISTHANSRHSNSDLPEFLVISWLFKSAFGGKHTAVVHLFQRNSNLQENQGFLSAFRKFVNGGEEEQKKRLKFAFKVVKANSALKATVAMVGGERPVIMPKALKTHFFQGENYLEFDQDVGSSSVGRILNSAVQKACNKIVIDTSWMIEPQHEDELPEQLVALVRWQYIDLSKIYVDLDKTFQIV